MPGIPHPYYTADLPGTGGAIKKRTEDFRVEEVPLYDPCGSGEHTYFELEKEDISTLEALELLGQHLRVDVRAIGYAGLKDRKAVTRQTLSLAGVTPEDVLALDIPNLRIRSATRHTNKLRVGHLRGNRFQIWIRGALAGADERAARVIDVLRRDGVPNYYGFQRFGNRGNAHLIGRDLLLGEHAAAVRRILGDPSTAENNPHVVRGRELFLAGDLPASADAFPPSYREEHRLLAHLTRSPGDFAGALARLRPAARKLYGSAYQSYLFNLVLSERLESLGRPLSRLLDGDVAYLHRNGALFLVEEAAREAPRAASFEVSPSGPIFGQKMLAARHRPREIEESVLRREGIDRDLFEARLARWHLDGSRRPLVIPLADLHWRGDGDDLYLEFFLPKGSYATTVLREIMKTEEVPDAFYEEGAAGTHDLWRPPSP